MKSFVSNHLELVEAVYKDASAKCVADVSDFRDLETIRSRVRHEGMSFLTITLPSFARDLEKGLALGYVDSTCFKEFKKHGAIPAFLQGMLSLIFDRETGRIYDEVRSLRIDHSTIIDSIRQVCLAFKKVEIECSPARVNTSIQEFVRIERDFQAFVPQDEDVRRFRLVSSMLWDNLLVDIQLDSLSPKHGPGATAERISGNQKFRWRYWHQRLEPYFPLVDCAYSISAFGSEELEMVTLVPAEREQPVRVTPVPKTLKGPRIIAIEPCCMQYSQQAIRASLYDCIESSEIAGGHVNFRDQSVNQKLAVIASKTGQYSTIDLSEASDRVPRDLALDMFSSNPDLRDAIDACRSTHAELPDGTVIGPLKKFASMGSALCFPVESMYFYTLCVGAILEAKNLPVSHANCFIVSRDIYVYGDDIIVPSAYATIVLDHLQKYHCKVNVNKTFYSGKFRESCGVDAFDGVDVTPVYIRQVCPENKQQVKAIVSWVKTANLFYKKGYWRTAQHMFNRVEKYVGSLPYVSEESPCLGRVSFLGYRSVHRWNVKFQRFEVKAWVPGPVLREDELDGYAALNKSLSSLETLQSSPATDGALFHRSQVNVNNCLPVSRDALHLEQSALHGAVALKLRWVPA